MIAAIGRYQRPTTAEQATYAEVAMPIIKDITGQKFSRLTVIAFAGRERDSHSRWLCRCDCGKIKVIDRNHIVRGKTRSCGCLKIRHGHSTTSFVSGTYHTWDAMLQRCLNPNNRNYYWYGERGITVCARWLDFANFFADMGERPEGYSIERIDVNGNYEPSNCKWIPKGEQWKNRRPWTKREVKP